MYQAASPTNCSEKKCNNKFKDCKKDCKKDPSCKAKCDEKIEDCQRHPCGWQYTPQGGGSCFWCTSEKECIAAYKSNYGWEYDKEGCTQFPGIPQGCCFNDGSHTHEGSPNSTPIPPVTKPACHANCTGVGECVTGNCTCVNNGTVAGGWMCCNGSWKNYDCITSTTAPGPGDPLPTNIPLPSSTPVPDDKICRRILGYQVPHATANDCANCDAACTDKETFDGTCSRATTKDLCSGNCCKAK